MISYYIICSIIIFLILFNSLITFKEKKLNFYVSVILFIMLLSAIGYLTISLSNATNEAVLGTKISYLGGCFISPLAISIICVICNYKLKPIFIGLIYLPSFILFCSVLTIGYTDFYYINQWIEMKNSYAILGHDYGIGHNLYYIILVFYTLLSVCMIIHAIIKNKPISKKDVYLISILLVINTSTSILNSALNINLELAPIMFIIDGIALSIINQNSYIYNIEDSLSNYINTNNFNYIILAKNLKYIGSSKNVVTIFPEIAHEKINYRLSNNFNNIYEWINKFNSGENNFKYLFNDRIYTCTINTNINYSNKIIGYVVSIVDETDKIKYLNLIENYNIQLENEVSDKTKKIERIQNQALKGMASIIEGRDSNTGGHIKRTSDIVEILINEIKNDKSFNYSDEFCEGIVKAAPLHDLGKISIDDTILKKPARLTPEEFEVIKTHSTISAKMVKAMFEEDANDPFVKLAINLAKYHHEKWNGMGYPDGLKGEEIPFEARVMAIADVYDALVSKRCYKEAMSFEEAYNVMIDSMGSHFDPNLKQAFINCRQQLEDYYKVIED